MRLAILIKLRWVAIIGQCAAIVLVYFGLGFALNFVWCAVFVALSVWLNVFLSIKFKANYRIRNKPASLLLAYDILQLAALLYLTGGLQNPFAIFLLAPTTIAAGLLLLRQVFVLSALTLACASILAFYYHPLPWFEGEVVQLPDVYILGVWCAIFVAMAFFGFFAWRVAEDRRHMNEALSASELVLAREQQLAALDGMAAAMAHELGTPLSTINLAAKEMFEERGKHQDISEDIELIYAQSLKCKEVLSQIGREKRDDLTLSRMSLALLVSELVDAHQVDNVEVLTSMRAFDNKPDAPDKMIYRNPAIILGLGNILSNAVKFAQNKVLFTVNINKSDVIIHIEDDGAGFDSNIIEHLGDPLISQFYNRPHEDPQLPDDTGEGLGLGLFIAKTFLERSGAQVSFSNLPHPKQGACVEIVWKETIFLNMLENNKKRPTS